MPAPGIEPGTPRLAPRRLDHSATALRLKLHKIVVPLPLAVVVEAVTEATVVSTVLGAVDVGESELVLLVVVGAAEMSIDIVDDKVVTRPVVDGTLSVDVFTVIQFSHVH